MKDRGPSLAIPRYLQKQGYHIIPVNPKFKQLMEQLVYDSVDEIDAKVDIVDVFRRSEAVEGHVDEILNMTPLPDAVWFQLGIRNDTAARRLESEGITVVQDKCIKIEHQRHFEIE